MAGRLISTHLVVFVLPMRVSHTLVREDSMHTDAASSHPDGGLMTLSAAAAQGAPAALVSPLGTGPNSFAIRQQLVEMGMEILIQEFVGDISVTIRLIERNGLMTSTVTAGIEPEPSRIALDRMVLRPGDPIHIAASDLTTPHSTMAPTGWRAVLPVSVRLVVSVSPAVEQVPVESWRQLLKHADIVTMNMREVAMLSSILATYKPGTGTRNLTKLEAALVRKTGTMGYEPQCEQGVEHIQVSALETRIADTTGVGDTHIATMCAALLKGKGIGEACSLANAVAAIVISHESTLPVPTLEQILCVVKEGKATGLTSQKAWFPARHGLSGAGYG